MKPRTALLPLLSLSLISGILARPAVAAGTPALGGQEQHVTILESKVEPAEAGPGDEVELVLKLQVAQDWHVYGQLETIGQSPTVRLGSGQAASTVKGKSSMPLGEGHDIGGMMSYWVVGEFEFRQTLKVADDAAPGEAELSGDLDYTVCNEISCLPPDQVAFTASFTVTEGSDTEDEGGAQEPPGGGFAPPGMGLPGMDLPKVMVDEATLYREGDQGTLVVKLGLIPGWHLYGRLEKYGDQPTISLGSGPVSLQGEAEVPFGEKHTVGGEDTYWIEGECILRQEVKIAEGVDPADLTEYAGQVEYTVCNEITCDPPASVDFTAAVVDGPPPGAAADASSGGATAGAGDGAAGDGGTGDGGTEEGAVDEAGAAVPREQGQVSLLVFLLSAVGAGIFALIMPCTYPMIPITISFFTKQAEAHGGSRMGLSAAYGAGIVLIFILIGVLIGEPIMRFATHPITNLVIGAVFIVFAMSLFGLFTLEPPKFLMAAAGKASTKGGYIGVFLMGATLVVTSFTCSAPFIGVLLAMGANTGAMGTVALGMGVFGLTMAVPFVILSLLPGQARKLPKAGQWMATVKVFFGFVEIAAALKFFSNAEVAWGLYWLPTPLFLFIWTAVFFLAGLYLLGGFSTTSAVGGKQKLAAILTLLFAFYCTWGAAGGTLDRTIMTAMAPPYDTFGNVAHASESEDGPIIVEDDLEEAIRVAQAKGRAVLINFTGIT